MQLAEINDETALYEQGFRTFFRADDRPHMESLLFNVPARLVAGCWATYENLAAILRAVLEHYSPETIGRRMKMPAARPGVFHLTCLMVSYLIGRQQEILVGGGRPGERFAGERVEEMAFLFSAAKTMLTNARNDGCEFPFQAGGALPILSSASQRELLGCLSPPTDEERRWRRRLMASGTSHALLFHGEMRDGIFNHGPYPAGEGRVLLVRELSDLKNDFLPWASHVPELPVRAILRAMVIRDARIRFDVIGNLEVEPADFESRIERDGLFRVEEDRWEPIGESAAKAIEQAFSVAQSALFAHFATWNEAQRAGYGALVHSNFLRGFWELLPPDEAARLRELALTGYSHSAERHLPALLSQKFQPVIEHIAKAEGPIFWPVVAR
jgi:hypothetical protein